MFLARLLRLRTTTPYFSAHTIRRNCNLSRSTTFGARHYTSIPTAYPAPGSQGKHAEPRLSLTFTCTAPGCSHRSTHEFARASYERGIVLVQCPGCKNRHLIADHLGWFKEHEGTAGGTLRTIEDLMRAKGEKVTRGRLDAGGVVEFVEED